MIFNRKSVSSVDTEEIAPPLVPILEAPQIENKEDTYTPPGINLEKPNDLERLRDILFGSQNRSTNKRLEDLEAKVDALHHDLTNLLYEKTTVLSETISTQITAVRKDLGDRISTQNETLNNQLRQVEQKLSTRLETQNTEQTSQLRAAQRELTTQLAKQENEQTTQLQTVQNQLTERVEQLTAEFLTKLRTTSKELSDQIEQLHLEKTERIHALQSEARQRDNSLRQELLNSTAALEARKVSRYQMAQMLMEVAQRLGSDGEVNNQ